MRSASRIQEDQERADELKHLTREEIERGLQTERWRILNRIEEAKEDDRAYREYIATMTRLLDLDPADFDPGKFKIEDLIPRKSLGELNTVHDLQHYVTGPAPGGLVVSADGTLDMETKFPHYRLFLRRSPPSACAITCKRTWARIRSTSSPSLSLPTRSGCIATPTIRL